MKRSIWYYIPPEAFAVFVAIVGLVTAFVALIKLIISVVK